MNCLQQHSTGLSVFVLLMMNQFCNNQFLSVSIEGYIHQKIETTAVPTEKTLLISPSMHLVITNRLMQQFHLI